MMGMTGADSNTGLSPVDWGGWETTWTGTSTNDFESDRWTETESTEWGRGNRAQWRTERFRRDVTTEVVETSRETFRHGTQERSGTQTIVLKHLIKNQ